MLLGFILLWGIILGFVEIRERASGAMQEDNFFVKEELTDKQLSQRIGQEIARLQSKEVATRRSAAEALKSLCGDYPEGATAAIPALVICLGDEDEEVRDYATWGLRNCGKGAIQPLIEALKNKNVVIRRNAAKAFVDEILAPGALPELRACLKDADAEVRLRAAIAIAIGTNGDDQDLQLLMDFAKRGDPADRAAGLRGLGVISAEKIQGKSFRWADSVRKGVKDQDKDVRWSAFIALEALEIDGHEKILLYVSGLEDTNEGIVWTCLQELEAGRKEGLNVRNAVAGLRKLFSRQLERHVHSQAAKLLGEIGADAKPAVPDLLDALNGDDVFVVAQASIALWRIEKRTKESLPVLKSLLIKYAREPGKAQTLCMAVNDIGPAAASLAPEIANVLEGEDWDTQLDAAEALGAIASADPVAVNALVNALHHKSGIVRDAAMQALSKLGKDSVPLLAKALEEEPKSKGGVLSAISRAVLGGEPFLTAANGLPMHSVRWVMTPNSLFRP